MSEEKERKVDKSTERKAEARLKTVVSSIEGKAEEYGMTKRTLYSILGILGCFVLTVVMSITGMGFDNSVFMTWNYWTGMIIQFAISIFAMITGQQIGDDTQRNKPDSQYRKELKKYSTERKRVDDNGIFEYFDAWLECYRQRKIEKKIRETLQDFGIKQPAVLDLDQSELDNLKSPWVKSWVGTEYEDKYIDKATGKHETAFKSLTEEQIEVIRQIMRGYVTVSNVSASYFMDALKNTSADEWERAAKAEKKKGGKLASGYSYRLIVMLLLSVIVNGLTAVPYDSAGGVALNIATRIFILISSAIWGVYLGFKVVEMDIVFLAYKTGIIKLYADEVESGAYKIETIEKQAREDYDNYIKQGDDEDGRTRKEENEP